MARINPISGQVEAVYRVDFCSPAGLALGASGQLLVGCNTVFDTLGAKWNGLDPNTAAPQYVIIRAADGAVITNILGAGVGDEVWYNPGDDNFYAASSGSPLAPSEIVPATPLTAQGAAVLGVIDATAGTLLQLVPTFNVPAVTGTGGHPAGTAHSVAASATTNHVFVPLAANNVYPDCLDGCIAVYGR